MSRLLTDAFIAHRHSSHVKHSAIAPWQLLYVTSGLLTLVSVPVIYMIIDSDVVSARFLTEEERPKAIERLRANQTGTGTNEFKWDQVVELLLDIKTYLFLALCIMVNTGQGVTIYFGPTLINNFGFGEGLGYPRIINLLLGRRSDLDAAQHAVRRPSNFGPVWLMGRPKDQDQVGGLRWFDLPRSCRYRTTLQAGCPGIFLPARGARRVLPHRFRLRQHPDSHCVDGEQHCWAD